MTNKTSIKKKKQVVQTLQFLITILFCVTGRVPSDRRVPGGGRIPISVKVEEETLGGVGVLLPPRPPG